MAFGRFLCISVGARSLSRCIGLVRGAGAKPCVRNCFKHHRCDVSEYIALDAVTACMPWIALVLVQAGPRPA